MALCSMLVTAMIRQATKKIVATIATKDFVQGALKAHSDSLMEKITAQFTLASGQNITNADVEARLRRVELAYGVKPYLPNAPTSLLHAE